MGRGVAGTGMHELPNLGNLTSAARPYCYLFGNIKQQVRDYHELCYASRAPGIRLIKVPGSRVTMIEIQPDTTRSKAR
jgi:hypothetical protein